MPRHAWSLHEISDLSREALSALLDASAAHRDRVRRPDGRLRPSDAAPLAGRSVFQLFFENSTRTRVSFERAAGLLGAGVITFDASASSVKKGESLVDTIETLDAIGPDAIVVRHPDEGASRVVGAHTEAGVVNAGDGVHAHPTQGLLDALTIRDRFGRVEGLRVVITGDVGHSRVARSTGVCLRALGADVVLVAPPAWAPDDAGRLGLRVLHDLDDALRGADVAYMLRIQFERHASGDAPLDAADYRRRFQLDRRRLGLLSPGGVLMHPGPVNRGVEVAADLVGCDRSLILEQVRNGVFVRMAVLARAAGTA